MPAPCKVWNEESIEKQVQKIKSDNLTIAQLAAILQVSHITVRRWIRGVKLIAWNTRADGTGRWRIPKESLAEFMQERSCMNIEPDDFNE